MTAKTRIVSCAQNLKNYFSKGILNKIWLKVEHKYIYIFWNKINMAAKSFVIVAMVLIYAN